MKVTIEYNLPDDAYEYAKFKNCNAYMLTLQDMHEWLRSQVKYSPEDMSQDAFDAYEMVREKLFRLLKEYNADLYPDEDI